MLPISAVSRRTGIPVSTLRFYERELPGVFRIRKTAGGHRRYLESDVARFVTVRRLSETEGMGLAEIRSALRSGGEPDAVRRDLDGLLDARAAEADLMGAIERRLSELEKRVAALESRGRPRGWLRR